MKNPIYLSPSNFDERMMRGGSGDDIASEMRVSEPDSLLLSYTSYDTGFRIFRTSK